MNAARHVWVIAVVYRRSWEINLKCIPILWRKFVPDISEGGSHKAVLSKSVSKLGLTRLLRFVGTSPRSWRHQLQQAERRTRSSVRKEETSVLKFKIESVANSVSTAGLRSEKKFPHCYAANPIWTSPSWQPLQDFSRTSRGSRSGLTR